MTSNGLRVAFSSRGDAAERAAWLRALREACPGVHWVTEFRAGETFDAAVVANPPPGTLSGLKGLRLIQSLWAGVDRVLQDETLPADVPLARMVDPSMTAAMAETALWAVLSLHRGFFDYAAQQGRAQWLQRPQRRADEINVLVLGHGVMGQAVADRLAGQGYRVTAWRRRATGDLETPARDAAPDDGSKGTVLAPADAAAIPADRSERSAHGPAPSPPGAVRTVGGGAALGTALPHAEILINLLPLTAQTRGFLAAPIFSRLPRGAAVINLGRGGHLVEADLLAALDSGQIARAVLDVFAQEPLPPEHPFWARPQVTVLPHVAALTDYRTAAAVVADNLERLARGQPLRHLVDRRRGY